MFALPSASIVGSLNRASASFTSAVTRRGTPALRLIRLGSASAPGAPIPEIRESAALSS